MKNKTKIANHAHISVSSIPLSLCAKFFHIVLFMVIALAFGSCPYELSRFPVLPGEVRISPSTEVTVDTQVTVEYIPKYSGTYTEQVSYQWSQDGTDIPGETSTVFTPAEPGAYTVTMSAYFYESIDRVITAVPEIDILNGMLVGDLLIIHRPDATVGDELAAEYNGSETVSFQWNKNGMAIAGAINSIYTPLEPGVYTVTISVPEHESKTSEPVTVNPINAVPGTITISSDANAVVGNLLTATYIGSETVSFQWNKDGIAIPGATGTTYTPLELGMYTVTVSSEGYNSLTSAAVTIEHTLPDDDPGGDTNPVQEPGASVSAPTLASKTHDSITLNAVSAPGNGQTVEYAYNTTNTAPITGWQTGLIFSDLDPLTEYYLFARSKESNNYNAGTASTGLAVITRLIEMAWIPAGTFQMGSPTNEVGRKSEETQHTVTLTNGFYMGVYQVTQKEWKMPMGKDNDRYLAVTTGTTDYGRGDNYPMYYVSWYDALVFCNRLSMEEKLTPAYSISNSTDPEVWGAVPTTTSNATWNAVIVVEGSTGYRLPTEAQWEYACRASTATAFNDGLDDYSVDITAVELLGWFSTNSFSKTHELGLKQVNDWGLYDMHGNVYEWCWDWYNIGYYSSSPSPDSDPTGPVTGSYRVQRGGSSWDNVHLARSANRGYNSPYLRYSDVGFRLVRP